MKGRRGNTKRARRRSLPIHAYVGPNGGGKSLAMIYDTLPSLAMGRRVLSTVRILDHDNPRQCDDDQCDVLGHPHHMAAHPLYVPFTSFQQLLVWSNGDVLMDEVTGVASSRESLSLPAPVANYLVQLRRRDVLLRWTSPNWARADKIMREVSQAVTYCTGHLPVQRKSDDGTRLWRDRRLFFWRTYDATAFDEFTAHKRENVKALGRQMYWRPGGVAGRAYDTLDAVMALGATADGGLCMHCGGKRTTPVCSCPDQLEARAAARKRRSREDTTTERPPDPARHRPTDPSALHVQCDDTQAASLRPESAVGVVEPLHRSAPPAASMSGPDTH